MTEKRIFNHVQNKEVFLFFIPLQETLVLLGKVGALPKQGVGGWWPSQIRLPSPLQSAGGGIERA